MLAPQRMLKIKSDKAGRTTRHNIRKVMEYRDTRYHPPNLMEMDDAFHGPSKPEPGGRVAKGKE